MTHFVPMSEREHDLGNRGHDVADYCARCKFPFLWHKNGACPTIVETMVDDLPSFPNRPVGKINHDR